MKLPQPFTGWLTPKGKAYPTQEEAMTETVKEEMLRILYDEIRGSYRDFNMSPERAVEAILRDFNVAPKAVSQ